MRRTRILVGVFLAALIGAGVVVRVRAAPTGAVLFTIPMGQVSALYDNPAYRGALALDERSGHGAVATANGVRLLDTRAGTVLRTIPISQGYTTAIAADESAGRFIVAGGDVLDARSGAVLDRPPAPAALFPTDVVAAERAGRAFVLNGHADGESVSVLDARTGRLLRSTTVSTGIQSGGIAALAVDERTDHVFVTSPDDDSVDMLDARRGTNVATSLVARFPSAVAVDTRRARVFVAGNSGLIMLDARSGAVLRTILLGAAAAIAVDERTDRVFVVDSFTDAFNTAVGISGISVLDARSGAVLATTPVAQDPDLTTIAVDGRRGRIFVSSQGIMDPTQPNAFQSNGMVYELDARTGRLLRTLSVGVGPVALAVDEQTGHVVVLNSGGTVRVAGMLDGAPAWLRQCLSWLPSAQAGTRPVAGSVSVLDP